MAAQLALDALGSPAADERTAIKLDSGVHFEQLPQSVTPKALESQTPIKAVSLRSHAKKLLNLLQTEIELGTVFLFWPVWFGCGVLIYFSLENEPKTQHILAAGLFLLGLLFLSSSGSLWRFFLSVAILGSLGFAAAKLETLRFSTVMMGSEITTRITGTLKHAEEITKGRTRLVIDLISTERPQLKYAPERIRVSATGSFANVEAGSTVKGLVKLFALSGPVQPNGYDFAFESYFDGVGAAGFFLGKPEFETAETSKTVAQTIEAMRSNLTTHIRSIVPGDIGAVVAALVTGVRGAISEADNEALRRSGLAHVMSISGLHLALAAGVLIAGIRLGFAFFQPMVDVFPIKKIAASAGISIAILYCLLSGSEVATVRSTIMIVVMLGAVLVDRPAITMRNLAIAAFILIAVWPHEIAGPGFQMSFAATAGLIAIYRWWANWQSARSEQAHGIFKRFFIGSRNMVVATALTSTVAGLATLPFGAFHFERLSPWGTLSNLLALPAISFIIMPSAVTAMFAMPFGLDGSVWPVMAFGVKAMLYLAHMIAGFGGPDATGTIPVPVLLLSTLSLVCFCLLQTRLKLVGLFPLVLALVFLTTRNYPAILIDENAKMVAFVTSSNHLAISSSREDTFVTKNWQRTVQANDIEKPVNSADVTLFADKEAGFVCSKTVCYGHLPDGFRVTYVKSSDGVGQACQISDLVVQGFSGPAIQCSTKAQVIASSMLAKGGTAALYAISGQEANKAVSQSQSGRLLSTIKTERNTYQIKWSYNALNRPWQTHRVFSRQARNLAPKPKPEKRKFIGTGLQGRV